MRRLVAATFVSFALTGPALGSDYDTVRRALETGDCDLGFTHLVEMGDSGDTLAAIMLATLRAGCVSSEGLAVAWLEQAAAAGNVHAMIQLGSVHQYHHSLWDADERYLAALTWYEQAADAGSSVALSRLAHYYAWEVPSFPLQFPSDASEQGNEPQELPIDEKERLWLAYLESAAAAGRADAMFGLALAVSEDEPERAAALMQQAAALGEPGAVGTLAIAPDKYGVRNTIGALAWVLAAEIRWNTDRNSHSIIWSLMDVATEAEFLAWISARRDAAPPDVIALATVRAREISIQWTNLWPGHSAELNSTLFAQSADGGFDLVREALDAGDYDTAFAVLAVMGDNGDTLAACLLGNLLGEYLASPPSIDLAIAWLKKAADDGSVTAMIQLGKFYEVHGPRYLRDVANWTAGFADAIDWYHQAREAGSELALVRLGLLYAQGGISRANDAVTAEQEAQWAREYLERAVEAGDPEAMSALAMILRDDDRAQATSLMRRAAELGNPMALAMLANEFSEFSATDSDEALVWVLLMEDHWRLNRNSRIWLELLLTGEEQFHDWIDAKLAGADAATLAAAEARAAEMSTEWINFMPGASRPLH